jgi:hypothetical protein
MMRAKWEPPEKVGRPRTPLPADTTTTDLPALTKNQAAAANSRRAQRQFRRNTTGLYEHGWQAGFLHGRVDALRVAMRQAEDLDTLAVLTRLADEYALAAGDS